MSQTVPDLLSCDPDFVTELISDESVYVNYLNGTMGFDELVREMHRKGTALEAEKESSDESSGLSDDDDDEDYDPSCEFGVFPPSWLIDD